MQLYFMAAYDMDRFHEFIKSQGFSEVCDLPSDEFSSIIADEKKLLHFSACLLKQVLFGEVSVPVKENAAEVRLKKRKKRLADIQSRLNAGLVNSQEKSS